MTARKLGRSPQVTIEVNAEDIADAVKRDSSHCMIAKAVRVSVPDAQYISVDLQTIRFTNPVKGERYIYLTPRVAQKSIIEFDQGRQSAPFAFRLRAGQTVVSGRGGKVRKASFRRPQGGASTSVPEIVGGTAPPGTSFKGRIRTFGVRSLEF